MAEKAEAPSPGGAQKANEAVKVAVQSTDKYARIAMQNVRKSSGILIEKVGEAREQAPLLKGRALELLAQLQELEAFQLRRPQGTPTFGTFCLDLNLRFGSASPELKALSTPAVGGAAVVALRLIASIDACISQILVEAFYTKTLIGRTTFVALAVPGYVAAAYYTRKLAQVSEEVEPLDLAGGALRLPLVFWVTAVASGTVTIKVMTEIVNSIVRRVFSIRLRTLILAAAMFGGLQHPRVQQQFHEISRRIPPGLAQSLEDFWFKFQAVTRAFAHKIGPTLESFFEQAETKLHLTKGTLPRATIMEIPKDLNIGNVGNLEMVDAPLFTGPTDETEERN